MPTLFTHPAVPLAIAVGLGRTTVPKPVLLGGVILSILPDADIVAFLFGIPYAANHVHRGLSHSLLFALGLALIGALWLQRKGISAGHAFCFLAVAGISHSVLDAFTDGGLGIAFLWPWADGRYFAPFQPIVVTPLSLARCLSMEGLRVLCSELVWVWLPCIGLALTLRAWRSLSRQPGTPQ